MAKAKEQFKKLDDYQHARLRTEMYLGSREVHTQSLVHYNGTELSLREFSWVPALYTGLRELIDNAIDEMVGHSHGTNLKVTYNPKTLEFSVEDNGRGLPIEEKKELGKGPAASVLLGEARAGRNFDEREQVAGTNGLGAACTNFTSEWFTLEVWRGGRHLKQTWKQGTSRGKPVHKTTGATVRKSAAKKRGTKITYKPSALVFPSLVLPIEFVEGRLWDIAVANPNLKVSFNGKRLITSNTKDPVMSTYFKGTASVGKITIANHKSEDLRYKNFRSWFYLKPNFTSTDAKGPIVHSMVNSLPAFQGGTHMDEFAELFYPVAIRFLKKKAGKEELNVRREDIAAGLLVLNVTEMHSQNFDSQTKGRLISEVRNHMRESFDPFWVESIFRRNPTWANEILDRCRDRKRLTEDKDVARVQRKMQSAKVASLDDATGKDRSKCILFIAEGDSAIGGISDVRNPKIHGGIKLTGKIMNVYGLKPKKVVENKVLSDIMTSIGLVIGQRAKIDSLRYGAIFIAADEDEDGKNITALVVNFFYRFWPELLEK